MEFTVQDYVHKLLQLQYLKLENAKRDATINKFIISIIVTLY